MREFGPIEISVVVPAYNEEERLTDTLPRLWKGLRRRFDRFEVIVVDDGSTDGTGDVVLNFAAEHKGVQLIRYGVNRGKGYAVRTGMLNARGRYVLFSDADLSTPIREVRKVLGALKAGADVAIGSRASSATRIIKSQPCYRVLMGKSFNKIVRVMAVPGIADTQCGFKCFTREAAREIFNFCTIDGFGFDVELLLIARHRGFAVKEVGVLWENSLQSRVDPVRDSLRMFRDLFAIRWNHLLGSYGPAVSRRVRIEA